jgi:replicative DNA helicase
MENTHNAHASTAELVDRAMERINYRYDHRHEPPVIAWGFEDLDAMTFGIQRPTVTIIGARPSMGKTAFLINIALNVALGQNKPVAIFTTEDSAVQTVHRMLTIRAQTGANCLRTANLQGDDWANLALESARLKEAPLSIYDRCTTFQMLAEKCRLLKKRPDGLDVVFIDDLQTLLLGEFQNIRPENHTQMIWQLKSLARELETAIIITSNLSRATEYRSNKRPQISDIRGGGVIGDGADIIMMIYREEYYYPETEFRGEAEIIICRQKDGPVGTAELAYNASTCTFSNMKR